jgi:hypothetical protein
MSISCAKAGVAGRYIFLLDIIGAILCIIGAYKAFKDPAKSNILATIEKVLAITGIIFIPVKFAGRAVDGTYTKNGW